MNEVIFTIYYMNNDKIKESNLSQQQTKIPRFFNCIESRETCLLKEYLFG